MSRLFGLALTALVACSSPSLKFQGTAPIRIVLAEVDIDVYRREAEAQAIVLSSTLGWPGEDLARLVGVAIQRATGCALKSRSLRGETSVWQAKLTKCKPPDLRRETLISSDVSET
ncbi:MAG: hypothetical protein ACFBSD_11895 [Paracoccaceae bacterium]